MVRNVKDVVGKPFCDKRGRYVGFYQDSKNAVPGHSIYEEYYHDCREHGWAGLVSARSKFVGGICEVCGDHIASGAHHVNGKSNSWGNLIVVCRDCHANIHKED